MDFLAFFFVYSIIGWAMDTAYRSWGAKTWAPGNALKPLPIAPVYGFGALFILAVDPWVRSAPIFLEFFLFGIGLALFEFASGIFSEKVFHRRLWNYGHVRGWSRGYTDLWHLFIWGALALVLTRALHPLLTGSFSFAS